MRAGQVAARLPCGLVLELAAVLPLDQVLLLAGLNPVVQDGVHLVIAPAEVAVQLVVLLVLLLLAGGVEQDVLVPAGERWSIAVLYMTSTIRRMSSNLSAALPAEAVSNRATSPLTGASG